MLELFAVSQEIENKDFHCITPSQSVPSLLPHPHFGHVAPNLPSPACGGGLGRGCAPGEGPFAKLRRTVGVAKTRFNQNPDCPIVVVRNYPQRVKKDGHNGRSAELPRWGSGSRPLAIRGGPVLHRGARLARR